MTPPIIDRSLEASPLVGEPTPPIDVQLLLSRCMSNVPLALALIDEFESNGSRQVATIVQNAIDGNVNDASAGAHSLKGAAGIIGAQSLSAIAAQVEAAKHEDHALELLNLTRQLEEEMNRCLSYVSKLRQHVREI